MLSGMDVLTTAEVRAHLKAIRRKERLSYERMAAGIAHVSGVPMSYQTVRRFLANAHVPNDQTERAFRQYLAARTPMAVGA